MGKIGVVSNYSAARYIENKEQYLGEVILADPKSICLMAHDSSLDAALISAAYMGSMVNKMEPLWGFGIAAKKKSISVIFASDTPLETVLNKGVAISCSGGSVTGVKLLKLMCAVKYDMPVIMTRDNSAACLMIGNHALKSGVYKPYTVDLTQWWYEMTGLPFVYAVWMVLKTASDTFKSDLKKWLMACVSDNSLDINKIASREEIDSSTLSLAFRDIENELSLGHVESAQLFAQMSQDKGIE